MEKINELAGTKDNDIIELDKVRFSVLIIGVLIFIAYMKQYIYYSYFGIDISEYVEIQEVFTPFIDDLTTIFVIALMCSATFITDYFAKNNKPKTEKSESSILKWISIILFILILGTTFTLYYLGVIDGFAHNIYYVSAFILLVFLNLINERISILENKYSAICFYFLFGVILYNLIGLSFIGSNKRIEYKNITRKFFLEDKAIVTDSLNIYLGRTKSNFFIYHIAKNNRDTSKAIVYNISEIKTEEVYKRKNTIW